MPIYEYECTQCGHIHEVLQKFSDKPLTKCSQCSGRLHKLVSHSSFHLKGSGWYVTDYAGKSNKPDTPSKTKTETKTETKTPSPAPSTGASEKE